MAAGGTEEVGQLESRSSVGNCTLDSSARVGVADGSEAQSQGAVGCWGMGHVGLARRQQGGPGAGATGDAEWANVSNQWPGAGTEVHCLGCSAACRPVQATCPGLGWRFFLLSM